MRNRLMTHWSKSRLRVTLALFFLALLIPTAFLIKQAYSQLKWEAFHRHRGMAEELVKRIDRRYAELIEIESARSFTEYTFLNIAGVPDANFLQRSPLASLPVKSALPGVIGYFQIDPQGRFSTPLLPPAGEDYRRFGISAEEYTQRSQLQNRLLAILTENQLLQKPSVATTPLPATAPELAASLQPKRGPVSEAEEQAPGFAQYGFDKLEQDETTAVSGKQAAPQGLGRVEDLPLEDKYRQKRSDLHSSAPARETEKGKRVLRKEQGILPEQVLSLDAMQALTREENRERRVRMFESEIDAFEFSALDSGHYVLYRKVWRDGQRYIQGLLLTPDTFVNAIIRQAFQDTALSASSRLAVAYQGNVLSVLNSQLSRNYLASSDTTMRGTLLYQAALSAPLNDLELVFSIEQLPAGPGGQVVTWLALIILLVLCGGFLLMYRLAARQMTLARQQQDFVSAVSHELKTPLTSIRMYGEMLREGWAPEEKRKVYYDFIYAESERLTRLINNVLQLARMTRSELKLDLKPYELRQLMDLLRSKITTQVERAGFRLDLSCPEALQAMQIQVDADHFVQVIINLVDNALKFSARAEHKTLEIQCRLFGSDQIQFSVRDYGPGIARDQLRKIFRLFYRSENELTRETVGTGIGLALVQQLVQAMHGEVDVVNQSPGAEFRVTFPIRPGEIG